MVVLLISHISFIQERVSTLILLCGSYGQLGLARVHETKHNTDICSCIIVKVTIIMSYYFN